MAALLALSQKCDSYDELKLELAKLDLPDEGLVAALADKLVSSFTDGLGINKDDKDA